LRDAERVLVFTGAGISTGSSIPDFRGQGGVWRTRVPTPTWAWCCPKPWRRRAA